MSTEQGAITDTIFIYDACGEEPIRFFVREGDYRGLNNLYVGIGVEAE